MRWPIHSEFFVNDESYIAGIEECKVGCSKYRDCWVIPDFVYFGLNKFNKEPIFVAETWHSSLSGYFNVTYNLNGVNPYVSSLPEAATKWWFLLIWAWETAFLPKCGTLDRALLVNHSIFFRDKKFSELRLWYYIICQKFVALGYIDKFMRNY